MCADIVQPCLAWYYICYSLYQTHPFYSSQLASCWSSLKHRWSLTSSPGLLAESGVPYILAHPAMLMCHLSIYHTTSASSFYYIYLAVPGLICGMQDLWSSLWHLESLAAAHETLRCSMWDLVPGPPALRVQSLRLWSTRKVPSLFFRSSLTTLSFLHSLIQPHFLLILM